MPVEIQLDKVITSGKLDVELNDLTSIEKVMSGEISQIMDLK